MRRHRDEPLPEQRASVSERERRNNDDDELKARRIAHLNVCASETGPFEIEINDIVGNLLHTRQRSEPKTPCANENKVTKQQQNPDRWMMIHQCVEKLFGRHVIQDVLITHLVSLLCCVFVFSFLPFVGGFFICSLHSPSVLG